MLEEMMPHGSVNLCLQEQFETADDSGKNSLKNLEISAKTEGWCQSVRDAEKAEAG